MRFREEQTFHYQQEMYKAKTQKINLDLRKRFDSAKKKTESNIEDEAQ